MSVELRLNKKLMAIVDVIAEQAGDGSADGRGVVNLQDWEDLYGIDFMTNGALRSTVLAMLNERPEIRDWELDGGRLIVWRELSGVVPAVENISDPLVAPPQKPERGSGEKPSIMAQIKAARQASNVPKDKPVDVDAQKHSKRKGGPEL